ncbi:MAG: ROK family protein, partial [Mycobacteriales bacterium]
MLSPYGPALACVEVGGGGIETIVLGGREPEVLAGAHHPAGTTLLMAVPGIVAGNRVVAASNLGWLDVDPAREVGLNGPALLVLNDAEAAALGESRLRHGAALTYVGLGTGVGGAVVRDGLVVGANLLGHGGAFNDHACPCGRIGCLETVAAGWALPDPLPPPRLAAVAAAVAQSVRDEPLSEDTLVVVAGGLARRHPALVLAVRDALPERSVEGS